MEFYKVLEDQVVLSNQLDQEDIALILDGRKGYIWKGNLAQNLNETSAKKIEKLIKNTFKDVEFELVPDLKIQEDTNPKLLQIKDEIKHRLPSPQSEKIKNVLGRVKNIKEKINEFRNYDNSLLWRKKLSNITNLWKLSLFNIILIGFALVLMFYQSVWQFLLGDYMLFIALLALFSIFFVDIVFLVFPMSFPLDVLSIGGESKKNQSHEIPKSPALPPKSTSAKKTARGKTIEVKDSKLGPIQLQPLKTPSKKTIKKKDMKVKGAEYESKEDMDLGIPAIPEAPKKKKQITIDSPGLSTEILEKMKKMESKEIKVVLVNCERCDDVIPVPVPKNAVLKSELPVVPISYIHNNLKDKDQHCITLHLDHDFDIRRQRISDVVLS